MTRWLIRLTVVVVIVLGAAGCMPEAGTVTSTNQYYNAQTRSLRYEVCVRDDQGHSSCTTVLLDDYVSCHKGDRWPDCTHR